MLCCTDCFDDDYLKDIIRKEGFLGNCDFCGGNRKYCIQPEDLAYYFGSLIDLYSIVEDFMPMYDLKQGGGDFLVDKLQDDWGLFAFWDYEKQTELLSEMFPYEDPEEGPPQFLSSRVERESEYWGTDYEVTGKMEDQWNEFSEEIKFRNRFFPQKQLELDRLEDLFSFFTNTISPDTTLFRSRISKDGKKFPPSKMGKPPSDKTKSGRANPKGIPYLYLASDQKTAIAEVRPAIDDTTTVGRFKVKEPLRVVNLKNPRIDSPFRFGDNLEYILTHLGFLRILGMELSKPISPIVEDLEYLPSQYLCEFIKQEGYDGIAYGSSIAKGYNLAVFQDNKLKCTSTKNHRVVGIDYDTSSDRLR